MSPQSHSENQFSGCRLPSELVLLGVLKAKMTAAVPLGVSKVIALKKKMTEIVIIFLKQVTFISEFLLKNSNATENYSVITNRNGIS